MLEIRNPNGRLVCRIDEANDVVEILVKGIVTTIQWTPEGKVRIKHTRKVLTA